MPVNQSSTPTLADTVRTLQLLRDMRLARLNLAFMVDGSVPPRERLKQLCQSDGQSALWLLFHSVDQLLAGGGASMKEEDLPNPADGHSPIRKGLPPLNSIP